MLSIIWLEILTKCYDEFCHKISESSLPLQKRFSGHHISIQADAGFSLLFK